MCIYTTRIYHDLVGLSHFCCFVFFSCTQRYIFIIYCLLVFCFYLLCSPMRAHSLSLSFDYMAIRFDQMCVRWQNNNNNNNVRASSLTQMIITMSLSLSVCAPTILNCGGHKRNIMMHSDTNYVCRCPLFFFFFSCLLCDMLPRSWLVCFACYPTQLWCWLTGCLAKTYNNLSAKWAHMIPNVSKRALVLLSNRECKFKQHSGVHERVNQLISLLENLLFCWRERSLCQ